MITIRLKPELEKIKPSPWELGKDLFGKYSSGKGNLSKDRKKILKQKLLEKHFEKAID